MRGLRSGLLACGWMPADRLRAGGHGLAPGGSVHGRTAAGWAGLRTSIYIEGSRLCIRAQPRDG